jgi:hypothetical protein
MSDLLTMATECLLEAGYAAERITFSGRSALAFENTTVLGFVFTYDTASDLIAGWPKESARAVSDYQLALRRAGLKAWNTYIVLLASSPGSHVEQVALAAIEEDLSGTRKIARSGVQDMPDLQASLLVLLPLQAAPKLEAVDIPNEIRQRTTGIAAQAVDAFLSTADDSVVMNVVEQTS